MPPYISEDFAAPLQASAFDALHRRAGAPIRRASPKTPQEIRHAPHHARVAAGRCAVGTGRDMRAAHREFSGRILTELLRALHARTTDHPENPGLIASWPGVPEHRMAATCAELRRRGHPVFRVYIEGAKAGSKRETWAIAATTDEPVIGP